MKGDPHFYVLSPLKVHVFIRRLFTFFVYLFIADDCVVVFLPVSYDGHCLFPMVIEGIRGIIVKLGDVYMFYTILEKNEI